MTRRLIVLFVAIGLLTGQAAAQWVDVAPGISYREMTLPGPIRVFIARADRSKDNWTIDTMTSKGTVKGGTETVPDMAKRYNDTVTFDGQRYEVKVAINGNYYNGKTGYTLGGQMMSGWFVKRYEEYSGGSGFFWTADRRCVIGGNVQNADKFQHVIFADKAEMSLSDVNGPRQDNALVLYTPQYDASTGTDDNGAEVLVRVDAPVCIMPKSPGSKGRIIEVRKNAGSTPIPFDCVVLSASGKAAAELLEHARPGQDLHIRLELKDYGIENVRLKPVDWHNAWTGLGDTQRLMIDGYISRHWEAKAEREKQMGKPTHGSVRQDPRTCIAYNKDYVFFVVIDGRSEQSIGMTFTQTAEFCKNELKADNAVMQDGGGSSTLWVDGQVRNTPSGKGADEKYGLLRPVANGYMIALVHPPKFSPTLKADQKVQAKAAFELKLGPGANYASAGKVAAGAAGQILKHNLDGVYATGSNWWPCTFGKLEGWATQEMLAEK
jgi:hypothetical protein